MIELIINLLFYTVIVTTLIPIFLIITAAIAFILYKGVQYLVKRIK